MSKELNDTLKEAYNRYKDDLNPPVPLRTIKEYLELEGINPDDDDQK
jgi:hypothetical protein